MSVGAAFNESPASAHSWFWSSTDRSDAASEPSGVGNGLRQCDAGVGVLLQQGQGPSAHGFREQSGRGGRWCRSRSASSTTVVRRVSYRSTAMVKPKASSNATSPTSAASTTPSGSLSPPLRLPAARVRSGSPRPVAPNMMAATMRTSETLESRKSTAGSRSLGGRASSDGPPPSHVRGPHRRTVRRGAPSCAPGVAIGAAESRDTCRREPADPDRAAGVAGQPVPDHHRGVHPAARDGPRTSERRWRSSVGRALSLTVVFVMAYLLGGSALAAPRRWPHRGRGHPDLGRCRAPRRRGAAMAQQGPTGVTQGLCREADGRPETDRSMGGDAPRGPRTAVDPHCCCRHRAGSSSLGVPRCHPRVRSLHPGFDGDRERRRFCTTRVRPARPRPV